VFGGEQFRPNVHIEDLVQAYLLVLNSPSNLINRQIFNVGAENLSLNEIASKVSRVTGIENIVHQSTDDLRSYRVDSKKIESQLGFAFKKNVNIAIIDLVEAFKDGKFVDSLNNPLYFNIKRMKELEIS